MKKALTNIFIFSVGFWGSPLTAQTTGNIAAAQNGAPKPLRMRVAPNVPKPIVQSAPMYPQSAISQGTEGNVVLHLIIAGNGTVKEASPVSGPSLLAQSAIETAKQWRYESFRINNNIAVEMDTIVTIRYVLGPPQTVTIDNQTLPEVGTPLTEPARQQPVSSQLYYSTGARESCEIPFVPTHYESYGFQSVVPNLTPSDFSARVGDVPANIRSAAIDIGPKRIGIVIDASRNIPADEWEREIEFAANFMEHARSGDSLSLFLVGVDNSPRPVASPSATAEELRKMMFAHPSTPDSTEKNYDALFAVAHSMIPARFGDTLFLFGHPDDVGSSSGPDQLQDVILKNKMRLMVMSFSIDSLGNSPKLDAIVRETGYYISYHQTLALNQPGQIALFEEYMRDVYGWIAGPYRLNLDIPAMPGPSELSISVSNAAQRGLNDDEIHYPRKLYSCSATTLQ